MTTIIDRMFRAVPRLAAIGACFCAIHLAQPLQAQLIFSMGDGKPIEPFSPPSNVVRAFAQKNHVSATLRFGYIADKPDAQSLRSRTEFNSDGTIAMIYDFDPGGGVSSKREYTYGTNGRIVAAVEERYGKNSELMLLLNYEFDAASGRITFYREVNAQGFERRQRYTYNAAGKLLHLQYLEPDGLPGGSEHYTYAADGRSVTMEKTDIAGDLVERATWTLDEKGRISQENRYLGSPTPALLYTYQYQYDSKGRLVRKEKLSRDLVPAGFEAWTYDAAGHVLEHKELLTGEAKPTRETFQYDSKGRRTQSIAYNAAGGIFQWYKYGYDSLGVGATTIRLRPDGHEDYKEVTVFNKNRQVLMHQATYSDGTGDSKTVYKYDANGLLSEEKHTEQGREESVYWFVHEHS